MMFDPENEDLALYHQILTFWVANIKHYLIELIDSRDISTKTCLLIEWLFCLKFNPTTQYFELVAAETDQWISNKILFYWWYNTNLDKKRA